MRGIEERPGGKARRHGTFARVNVTVTVKEMITGVGNGYCTLDQVKAGMNLLMISTPSFYSDGCDDALHSYTFRRRPARHLHRPPQATVLEERPGKNRKNQKEYVTPPSCRT